MLWIVGTIYLSDFLMHSSRNWFDVERKCYAIRVVTLHDDETVLSVLRLGNLSSIG